MWVILVRDFISGNKANSGLLPSLACLSSAFQGNLNERFANLYEKLMTLVQSLSCVWLFVMPWAAACQASLSFTISCSLLKLMSIESVMPSHHHILCCPLLLLPSVFPSIRVFFPMSQLFASGGQSTGALASASVLPVKIHGWFPLGLTSWISLQSSGHSRVFSSTTVWRHQFFVLSLFYCPAVTSIQDYWKNHNFDYSNLCRQSD